MPMLGFSSLWLPLMLRSTDATPPAPLPLGFSFSPPRWCVPRALRLGSVCYIICPLHISPSSKVSNTSINQLLPIINNYLEFLPTARPEFPNYFMIISKDNQNIHKQVIISLKPSSTDLPSSKALPSTHLAKMVSLYPL